MLLGLFGYGCASCSIWTLAILWRAITSFFLDIPGVPVSGSGSRDYVGCQANADHRGYSCAASVNLPMITSTPIDGTMQICDVVTRESFDARHAYSIDVSFISSQMHHSKWHE
jgi:hypothetical protein